MGLEDRLVDVWLGHSPENDEVLDLLSREGVPFVPIPIGGLSKPEVLVGSQRYRGLEEIRAFVERHRQS